MKAMGQSYMAAKRTMEINAEHPLFIKLNEVFNADKENPVLKEYVDLLYDEALIFIHFNLCHTEPKRRSI